MSVTVEGVLTTPIGTPLQYVSLRVTTKESAFSLSGAEAEVITGINGSYTFVLEEGVYFIEILQDDEYTEAAYVEVTSALTGSITLPQLTYNYPWGAPV